MVIARFTFTDQSKIRSFTIEGHAESVEEDEYDPVCGTISALSQSIINGIEECVSSDLIEYEVGDGYLSASLRLKKGTSDPVKQRKLEDAFLLMDVLHLGLVNISQGYPDSLTVIENRTQH